MKKILAAMAGLALLSGCAVIHKPEVGDPGVNNAQAWQEHKDKLGEFTHWSLQGRVATGKLLGWTGNLSWREQGERFDVRLAGPLGAGGMRARGTLESVIVDTDDGKHVETREPDLLIRKTLGWSFPLEALSYWVKGIPAPKAQRDISVDDKGLLRTLKQNGWTVSYQDYTRPEGAPTALPRRVILDNGDNRVRLVVDRWFDLDG